MSVNSLTFDRIEVRTTPRITTTDDGLRVTEEFSACLSVDKIELPLECFLDAVVEATGREWFYETIDSTISLTPLGNIGIPRLRVDEAKKAVILIHNKLRDELFLKRLEVLNKREEIRRLQIELAQLEREEGVLFNKYYPD